MDEESFCQAFLHPPLSAHLPYLAHHSLPLLYPFFPGRKHLELDLSLWRDNHQLGFWLHDELNFWYIPATMMLYLFAPAYMELIKRHPIYRWLPVVMIMWCILVQYVTPIHQAVGHLEIFWSRVPIFFIGINMGEMVKTETDARRRFDMDDMAHVPDDAAGEHLPGTGEARHVSALSWNACSISRLPSPASCC